MSNKKKKKEELIAKLSKVKEHVNVVFIGHVDAGKSTIAGQLMYKTGEVDKRALEKIEKQAEEKGMEGWKFAFVMDLGEEEREKGKTVEVCRAFFQTPNKRYTILDAPGHKAYVPSMIGGCSQADIAILVISARKGEFETGFKKGGQTREHATIAKTLGIKHLVVVINKMDEDTVKWNKGRYDEIKKDLNTFLFKQLGFSKKYCKFIPISGLRGYNITEPLSKDLCTWYDGKPLVGTLDSIKAFNRKSKAGLRIPIIDKYKDMGCVVILGKVESGTIKKGQTVVCVPNNIKCTVVELKSHSEKIEFARPGENVQVFLKGINDSVVTSGMVLCDSENILAPVQEFIGNFLVIDKSLFCAGYSAMIHIHTAVERVTITKLISKINKKTGKKEKEKPKYGKTGEALIAVFKFDRPVCIEKFEDIKALGRFTVREDKTIAVGKVLKIKPMKKKGKK